MSKQYVFYWVGEPLDTLNVALLVHGIFSCGFDMVVGPRGPYRQKKNSKITIHNQFYTYFYNSLMWLTVNGGKKKLWIYEKVTDIPITPSKTNIDY